MDKNEYYTGIDRMRLISAILVIAIHTSPLACFTETGDFILTRVIARTAVPFFFMTTGYFSLSRYNFDNRPLLGFWKKTGIIYAAAVILYLPLNIYGGYFSQPYLLPNIIKDIIFDGTFYHLWYLPASMLGMVIARLLIQKLDYQKGLAAAFLLYLIGSFGDSYYGISEKLPIIKNIYGLFFEVFDYTRNGIFFAPLFIILGSFIAGNKRVIALPKAIAGFIISFAFMFAEAMLLHENNLQRHDSMYVFLPACMFFLFNAALHSRGKQVRGLRTVSLIIYIIHPIMIVAVRAAAKLFHLQNILIDNSLIHFAAVCTLSVIFSFFAAIFWKKYGRKECRCTDTDRAYIEIDLENLSHNAKILQSAMPPGCELMAVVKTEAYGHGAYFISTCLEKSGVKAFAVATIDEGIRLRRYGIRGEILILGYTDVRRAKELKKYRLTQTLIDFAYAKQLNRQTVPVKVHIKIDTGMHRLGFEADDFKSVKNVFNMKYLKVDGMYSHLCCSGKLQPEDIAFTKEQIARFYKMANFLKESGISVPKLHIQSSYGLLNYPDLQCCYVRAGLSLYGVSCSPDDKTFLQLDLRPVLALKAKIVLIRNVPRGEYIGYDRAFMADRDSRIAVLPIGYGDGFPRNLSCGMGQVRVNTHIVPIIGRICMDQLAIDITDAEDTAIGDTAILIDSQDNSLLSTPYVAERSDSISNELLSRMGARLPIVIRNNK